MKASKLVVIAIIIVIAGYFVFQSSQKSTAEQANKPQWHSKIDKSADGKLSVDELKTVDANGDGKISKEEANAYAIPPEELKKWDKDGDGSISQEEMDTCGC